MSKNTCDAKLQHLDHTDCSDCVFYEGVVDNNVAEFGSAAFGEIIFNDFSVCYGNIELHQKKLVHLSAKEASVNLIFQFCGDVSLEMVESNKKFDISCNQQTITFNGKGAARLNLKGCPAMKFFEVSINPAFFKKYLPDNDTFNSFLKKIDSGIEAKIAGNNGKITALMQKSIDDIMNTKREGALKRLFIESKILELLLLQIEYFSKFKNADTALQSVHQSHLNKIVKAKEIIEENTYTPCSLIDLAHMVGTNECTLKKGFKELTGNTVFGYWNDLKMKDAYNMIIDSDVPIYEIAYQLGYKYPHHFTTAFKKKHGITPADLRSSVNAI